MWLYDHPHLVGGDQIRSASCPKYSQLVLMHFIGDGTKMHKR